MTARSGHRSVSRRLRATWHDERGLATNVAVIALAPLTLGLTLLGVQTVLWQHARTLATDRAHQTAALVATGELTAAAADTQLTTGLEDHPDLANVDVTVDTSDRLVTVTVAADAHGILVGTRTRIRLTTSTPLEGWQPLP